MKARVTTTYAISAYHHERCELSIRSWRGLLHATCETICGRSMFSLGITTFLHQ